MAATLMYSSLDVPPSKVGRVDCSTSFAILPGPDLGIGNWQSSMRCIVEIKSSASWFKVFEFKIRGNLTRFSLNFKHR
jgi:hypothetical protein